MKKFSFELEKILRLREHTEEEKKIALGIATGNLSLIENRIKATAEKLYSSKNELFKSDDAVLILRYSQYITRLENEKEKLLSDAAVAEAIVEEKRKEYLEASRDKKVLVRLKEKREADYKKAALKEEEKALDEVGSRRKTAELRKAAG